MSKTPQRVRGTQDIFGQEADRFQAVVDAFDRVRAATLPDLLLLAS